MSDEQLRRIAPDGRTLPVEVETGPHPTAAVIWLHGLGADGHDFEPIIPELAWPALPAVRFVFPHAPFRPVTINNGYVMRAWYDLSLEGGDLRQSEAHIREAVETATALIKREQERGIAANRIVLAGFSQGGAVVMHAGLLHPVSLAGIMALSAPLPGMAQLLVERHAANAATPVFLAHGTDDPIVPYALARESHRQLLACSQAVDWHVYPMGHSVSREEIDDIRQWLLARLASP